MVGQHTSGDRLTLLRAIFREIADEVDAAYAAAGDGSVVSEFDEELDRLMAEVLPSTDRFAGLTEHAARRFDDTFRRAGQVANLLDVRVPEPEIFLSAGIDFAVLFDLLGRRPDLEPVVAPYGLGAEAWQRAFARSGTDTRLLIAPEAAREFSALDSAPDMISVSVQDTIEGGISRTVRWTVRLIPAAAAPPLLGMSFAHGPHVTLPELLMLQLGRLLAHEEPVDRATFTWLAGSLAGGRLAARHVFDVAEHAVRVNCREPQSQGPHLGARSPVSQSG